MNREKLGLRILVCGSNDVASAVAHSLFGTGYGIVIHDDPKPTVSPARWRLSKPAKRLWKE